jgi:hypothetical protein
LRLCGQFGPPGLPCPFGRFRLIGLSGMLDLLVLLDLLDLLDVLDVLALSGNGLTVLFCLIIALIAIRQVIVTMLKVAWPHHWICEFRKVA